MAFCGVIGHTVRKEYMTFGTPIDKATSLMMISLGKVCLTRSSLISPNKVPKIVPGVLRLLYRVLQSYEQGEVSLARYKDVTRIRQVSRLRVSQQSFVSQLLAMFLTIKSMVQLFQACFGLFQVSIFRDLLISWNKTYYNHWIICKILKRLPSSSNAILPSSTFFQDVLHRRIRLSHT